MSRLKLHILEPEALKPFVPSLRELERAILYPIADGADTFAIDHGAEYHRFFSDMGYRSRFLVVEEDGKAVGSLAGAWRHLNIGDAAIPSVYLGDMKLAPHVRGEGVAAKMLWKAMVSVFQREDLRGWSLVWGAAMRGEHGDVTRSMRGAHPGRIASTLGITRLFFVPAAELADLQVGEEAPVPQGLGLDLSPSFRDPKHPPIVTTRGTKDFRLTSTNEPWPLVHVACGPRQWEEGLGKSLVAGANAALALDSSAICCFALDVRLHQQMAWLARRGLEAGATCTVYGFSMDARLPVPINRTRWIHLATCHI